MQFPVGPFRFWLWASIFGVASKYFCATQQVVSHFFLSTWFPCHPQHDICTSRVESLARWFPCGYKHFSFVVTQARAKDFTPSLLVTRESPLCSTFASSSNFFAISRNRMPTFLSSSAALLTDANAETPFTTLHEHVFAKHDACSRSELIIELSLFHRVFVST